MPTATATPTAPPVSAETLERLSDAVEVALGDGNRPEVMRLRSVDVDRRPEGLRVFVDWAINRGSSEWLTRTGAQIDVLRIVRAVQAAGMVGDVLAVQGSYALPDAAGRPEEAIVLVARFSRRTVVETNWERVSYDGVASSAEQFWIDDTLAP